MVMMMITYIYTHKMAYYSAIERNEGMPWIANATWMGLEIIILSEVSQTEKDKYHMKSLTCGISGMTQMNQSTKQKTFTDIENRFVVA